MHVIFRIPCKCERVKKTVIVKDGSEKSVTDTVHCRIAHNFLLKASEKEFRFVGNDFLGSFSRETPTSKESVQVTGSLSFDHQVIKRLDVVYRKVVYSSDDPEERYERIRNYTRLQGSNLPVVKSKAGFIYKDGESGYLITRTLDERIKAHLDITTRTQTRAGKFPDNPPPAISFQFR